MLAFVMVVTVALTRTLASWMASGNAARDGSAGLPDGVPTTWRTTMVELASP